jgi:poly-gamma-glutamate capsule biosynthesis protein CapA/YwtB (metallophosphatase superfamily)
LIKHSVYITIIILSLPAALMCGGSLSITVVGDIMMGSDFPSSNLPPDRGSGLLQNVDSILSRADITCGNLEGTLCEGGTCTKDVKKGVCYAFRTPPDFVVHFLNAGFDFLNLANNHMNDFGSGGIEGTMRTLDSAGIVYGGPYGATGHFEVESLSIGIVCFATSPNANTILEITKAQGIVASLAQNHDVVIVSFHGGAEGRSCLHVKDTMEYFLGNPRGNVVKFAHAMIDSGADLVWGHGPHVPRAMEVYNSRLIAYSLGNFCTWGFNVSEELGYAPILTIVLDSIGAFVRGHITSALQHAGKDLVIDEQYHAARLIRDGAATDKTVTSHKRTDPVIGN